MPIYEYACRACDHRFETLVRGQSTPECPACHGTDLERTLSTFAVGAAGPKHTAPSGPCGTCGDPRGPGSCALN